MMHRVDVHHRVISFRARRIFSCLHVTQHTRVPAKPACTSTGPIDRLSSRCGRIRRQAKWTDRRQTPYTPTPPTAMLHMRCSQTLSTADLSRVINNHMFEANHSLKEQQGECAMKHVHYIHA
jgi:hypothetical protein